MWACTYENANHQLAAWGAVFLVSAPKLEIIHRAGQVHSNIDPLSRLPRALPNHISPIEPNEPSIHAKESLDERQDVIPTEKMATFSFTTWSIEDCVEEPREVMINVRSRNKKLSKTHEIPTTEGPIRETMSDESEELDMLVMTAEYWGAVNPPPTLHLAMSEDTKEQWKKAYLDNPMFKQIVKGDEYRYNELQAGR